MKHNITDLHLGEAKPQPLLCNDDAVMKHNITDLHLAEAKPQPLLCNDDAVMKHNITSKDTNKPMFCKFGPNADFAKF